MTCVFVLRCGRQGLNGDVVCTSALMTCVFVLRCGRQGLHGDVGCHETHSPAARTELPGHDGAVASVHVSV